MATLLSKLSDEIRIGAGQSHASFASLSGTVGAVSGVGYGRAFFCFRFLELVVYSLLQRIALGSRPNCFGYYLHAPVVLFGKWLKRTIALS